MKLALRQEGLSGKAKEEPKFKFHDLYSRVLLADTLRCAWEQVRANKGAAGVDHVTFEDIERSKEQPSVARQPKSAQTVS